MAQLVPVRWVRNVVRIIDQTRLPTELVYRDIRTEKDMFTAIRELQVRGAPLIGICAAYGLCLSLRQQDPRTPKDDFMAALDRASKYLAGSRPTAVNLFWALDRMVARARSLIASRTVAQVRSALVQEAHDILDEDRRMCRLIGEHGYRLIKGCRTIQTHCNAGGLATSGFGTALAPIYIAREKGVRFHVYVDETRPLLQGSRITAFELLAAGIPATVVCDNMAAIVMERKGVDAVIVGADRIAANGDTANKVGTHALAIIARAHGVPFYVAAPSSTFDLSISSGEQIPIEERGAEEVVKGMGRQIAPTGVAVYNPAFDVTPREYIAAIITEKGVIRSPDTASVSRLMGS